jgi:hypothetical protein
MTRAELTRAGVTAGEVRDHWVRIEHGVYVHRDALLPEKKAGGFARVRRVPVEVLARAHALRNPGHVATGFTAAGVMGMRTFTGEEPLEFLVTRGARCSNSATHLRLTRTRFLADSRAESVVPDKAFPLLRCVPAGTALGHMIRDLGREDAAREARWRVPDLSSLLPRLTRDFIRSVQVSDALHQTLHLTEPGDPSRLRDIPVDLAAAVIGETDVGAESPPETLLRLVVEDLAPGLRSQIPVWTPDGDLLTSADLGWEEAGVFLFYDGEHHLERGQRDHDSEVAAAIQDSGGRQLRVTAGQLRDLDSVRTLRNRVRRLLGV